MDIEAITHLAFHTFGTKQAHRHREPGYIFYHGQRVAKLVLSLRRAIMPDDPSQDNILYVGALFHDAEKGNEPHNETGARLVQSLLPPYCSDAEVQAIAEIVWFHNQRNSVHDPFIKLVQDADVLDHQGTLAIWLLFTVTAAIGGSVPQAIAFWHKHREQEDQTPRLHYELSRNLFRQRRAYYNGVVEQLAREANGDIVDR